MLKTYLAVKTRLDDIKDRLARDDSGAALIEYSILIGLISAVAVGAVIAVGTWVGGQWTALNGILGGA